MIVGGLFLADVLVLSVHALKSAAEKQNFIKIQLSLSFTQDAHYCYPTAQETNAERLSDVLQHVTVFNFKEASPRIVIAGHGHQPEKGRSR